MSSRHRVLIVGGYGTFGGRLVELLEPDPRLTLIVAGRSLPRSTAYCAGRRTVDAELVPAAFDRDGDLAERLRALKPDIVIYLRADVEQLVRRVVQTTGFNYWECGMDLNLGGDMYDSFLEYQSRLLRIFDAMSSEYRFHVVETTAPIQDVCDEIKNRLEPLFDSAVSA